MEYFTSDDFANMQITQMLYDEENRGWSFLVEHDGNTYYLKDFTLPHPEDIDDDGYLVSVVKQKMLTVENKSSEERLKSVIEVQNDIIKKPITELRDVEYIAPDRSYLLEFEGPGYQDFFLDDDRIYKGNIHIILDLRSFIWFPGRYMKTLDWVSDSRLVNIKGNKIKLNPVDRASETKQGTWEYWDGSDLHTIEYNGLITKDMVLDGSDGSKYTVHIILNTQNMSWNYGRENIDSAWIGQGKRIIINGIRIDLKIGRTPDGFAWYYL